MVSVSFTELTMPSDPLILPEDDFADGQFDRDVGTAPRTLLLILSTPRSGSTLACDLLHQAGVCTAHEYFQPYQIRPAMMCAFRDHPITGSDNIRSVIPI